MVTNTSGVPKKKKYIYIYIYIYITMHNKAKEKERRNFIDKIEKSRSVIAYVST